MLSSQEQPCCDCKNPVLFYCSNESQNLQTYSVEQDREILPFNINVQSSDCGWVSIRLFNKIPGD